MKKNGILIFGIIGAMFIGNANAVQKCVALDSSATTCTYVNPGTYVVDWTSTCSTNGTSVPIKGISACSSNAGDAIGDTADALTLASDTTTHVNCWCKMVSPAVSSWVFDDANASAGDCALSCARYCAFGAANNSDFRSALFSVLGD